MISYFENMLAVVEKSVRALDERQFEKLAEDCYASISNDKKIIVAGLGKTVPICEKFVGTMNSFGMNVAFLHANTALHGDLGVIKDGDTVILLSKSGSTEETLLLLEHIRKRKAKVWCISFNDGGKLAKLCENCLLVQMEHEGDKWDIVPNNSSTLYLIILQGLAMRLAEKADITLDEFKANHPGGRIGELLREGGRNGD